ncbi:MAG: hypothetical protein LBP59_03470 [Planctomycetaceae bacterium]|nr:hypothetical protein [Planctomycetaceae bacterium]
MIFSNYSYSNLHLPSHACPVYERQILTLLSMKFKYEPKLLKWEEKKHPSQTNETLP